ncbi:MAG: hypothetical protein MRY74_12960 [Neomegalonema sp.]|nr:hypothetical protein [Neomegalonema sp.]
MSEIPVKVRTSLSDENDISKLAAELERHGFQPRHQLTALGLITGVIESGLLDALRALDGVDDVEEEPTFEAPPFDPKTPQ